MKLDPEGQSGKSIFDPDHDLDPVFDHDSFPGSDLGLDRDPGPWLYPMVNYVETGTQIIWKEALKKYSKRFKEIFQTQCLI